MNRAILIVQFNQYRNYWELVNEKNELFFWDADKRVVKAFADGMVSAVHNQIKTIETTFLN